METTVVKGLRILEALAASDQPCGITEVANACGITKSNTHRLLKTLVDCRYVRQDPATRSYSLTLKLWELGTRVHNNLDLRRVAAPHLRALAATTKESVHLSVLEDGKVMYVDKIDSTQAVRAYVQAGDRAPAYCVATGKAILAFQPGHVVDAATTEMRAFTPLTVVTREKLEADLARIRARGYALTRGEWRPGVLGIAAPIHGSTGPVVAAVGIAGPLERVKKADLPRLIEAVLTAARAISTDLGLGMQTRVPTRSRRRSRGDQAPAAQLAAVAS